MHSGEGRTLLVTNAEIIATAERLMHAWGNGKAVTLSPAEQRAFGHTVETRHGVTAVTKPRVLLAALKVRGVDISWAADFGLPI